MVVRTDFEIHFRYFVAWLVDRFLHAVFCGFNSGAQSSIEEIAAVNNVTSCVCRICRRQAKTTHVGSRSPRGIFDIFQFLQRCFDWFSCVLRQYIGFKLAIYWSEAKEFATEFFLELCE